MAAKQAAMNQQLQEMARKRKDMQDEEDFVTTYGQGKRKLFHMVKEQLLKSGVDPEDPAADSVINQMNAWIDAKNEGTIPVIHTASEQLYDGFDLRREAAARTSATPTRMNPELGVPVPERGKTFEQSFTTDDGKAVKAKFDNEGGHWVSVDGMEPKESRRRKVLSSS
jgi:hypothetical protein